MPIRSFHFRRGIASQQRPTVTGADDGIIPQLDHAWVLGTAEGIRINQLGYLAPGLASIMRTDEDEITIRIGVRCAGFAESPALGRAAKGNQQLAIAPSNDRREGAVE